MQKIYYRCAAVCCKILCALCHLVASVFRYFSVWVFSKKSLLQLNKKMVLLLRRRELVSHLGNVITPFEERLDLIAPHFTGATECPPSCPQHSCPVTAVKTARRMKGKAFSSITTRPQTIGSYIRYTKQHFI